MEPWMSPYLRRSLQLRCWLLCMPPAMLWVLSSQAQDRIKASVEDRMKASAAAAELQRDAQTAVVGLQMRVNAGEGFQLICRGGPGLRIDTTGLRSAPASYDLPPWIWITTMTVDFTSSPQPPDGSGRNLQPGQCSPVGFQLRDFDPTQIQSIMVSDAQWKRRRDGLPKDMAPNVAERYPDPHSITGYLRDPNHYWNFQTGDFGEGYFQSAPSRHWKPEYYKGPIASTAYPSTTTAVGLAGTSATKTQVTSSRYGGIATRTEGRAGTPAVPTPAPPPPPPPPVMVEPAPSLPVVFSPPLLQDGEQLWACLDAITGEADPAACSGAESAQAYCQLRDAESGPDVLIADAQPATPVRAVNGDICAGDLCRVVSRLQCDH